MTAGPDLREWDDAPAEQEPPYYLLADLLLHPELLLPPPVIVPRLAWEGRVTLLAAREKVGKSTLMGQAVAALSRGPRMFLDDDIEAPGNTLWLALDEPLGDLVRRLARYDADGQRVAIRQTKPDPQEFADLIRMHGARLVVVDHLTEYGAGIVRDAYSPTELTPILKTLRLIAQETNAAIVLLHHSAKASGDYRDSTAIGAGVDALVLMKREGEEGSSESADGVRACTCKGRVPNADYRMNYVGGLYELVDSKVPIPIQIQRVITANPGCTTRLIIGQVSGKTTEITRLLGQLESGEIIENRGKDTHSAWFTCGSNSRNGNGLHLGNGQGD